MSAPRSLARRSLYGSKPQPWRASGPNGRRGLLTLAIETSCDDTSVAVLETREHKNGATTAELHFHDKVTANTDAYGGIHPIVALESHHRALAPLVQRALTQLPQFGDGDKVPSSTDILWGSRDGQLRRKPDFISATRGPGMRPNLSVGLNTAKGLSLAWNVPLVGVHHMQAHALTPRMVYALNNTSLSPLVPDFPFLSLLVSGGHTMLISSKGLVDHSIIARCNDIALGDCLDKAARIILPPDALKPPYGRALELYAFPDGGPTFDYTPPRNREQELKRRDVGWGWSFGPPLGDSRGGRSSRRLEYSFSGLLTSVQRAMGTVPGYERDPSTVGDQERRSAAREVQRVAFEHLCGRLLIYLENLKPDQRKLVRTIVVSGGVAANRFLGHVFRSTLDVRGLNHVNVLFPPIRYCTDNAAMIAWAGCEMFKAGWRSELSVEPLRKWSLDSQAEDRGILGAAGWTMIS